MPLTDPVARRQTGGPAPLTITDLRYHAGCVRERGGRYDAITPCHGISLVVSEAVF